MKDLQIFEYESFNVRTVGEWFVGKDVAMCLGYKKPENAITRHVGINDKKSKLIPQPRNRVLVSKAVLINESGVYALIFGSKLESAKKFQHWVTSEVLPSIRKHGAYITPDVLAESIKNPDYMIGLLNELKKNQEKIAELKPLAENAKAFLQSDNTISVGDFAKMLSKNGYLTGRNDLFRTLRGMGYLQSDNIPYQQYINQGIFSTVEAMVNGKMYITSRVTAKGQKYLLKKLLAGVQLGRTG